MNNINKNCLKCKENLSIPKKEICSVCAWDFWFFQYMNSKDCKKLLAIQEKKTQNLIDLEKLNGMLVEKNEKLRTELADIEFFVNEKQKKLDKISVEIVPLQLEKESLEKKKTDLESQQNGLIEDLSFIKGQILQFDSLIKKSGNYSETNNRYIKVKFENANFFFQTNFDERPNLMMILQSKKSILGNYENAEYFINITDMLESHQSIPKTWKLSVQKVSLIINGDYFINFTSVHENNHSERILGFQEIQTPLVKL